MRKAGLIYYFHFQTLNFDARFGNVTNAMLLETPRNKIKKECLKRKVIILIEGMPFTSHSQRAVDSDIGFEFSCSIRVFESIRSINAGVGNQINYIELPTGYVEGPRCQKLDFVVV